MFIMQSKSHQDVIRASIEEKGKRGILLRIYQLYKEERETKRGADRLLLLFGFLETNY